MKNSTVSTNSYPAFMNHPFWDKLRIHPESKTLAKLMTLNQHEIKEMISETVKGFYPISYASLLSFKRFADLADNPESKAIAYEIYLVEKGDRPLIEGSEFTGVRHCDQLKMMFESLFGHNATFPIDEPETFEVLQNAKIEEADMVKSMAICDLIETTAPYVIHFYQDFLIQCQLALGVSSENVKRAYLDEHNLTEGDACEDQHIEMLYKMKGNYAHLVDSEAYRSAQKEFISLVSLHLDQSLEQIAA